MNVYSAKKNNLQFLWFNTEVGGYDPVALSICTWFLKNQVWKIKLDELDSYPAKINTDSKISSLK